MNITSLPQVWILLILSTVTLSFSLISSYYYLPQTIKAANFFLPMAEISVCYLCLKYSYNVLYVVYALNACSHFSSFLYSTLSHLPI